MNKKMRELNAQIEALEKAFDGYMAEGEGRDLAKAEETVAEIEKLKKEYELEARKYEKEKASVPENVTPPAGQENAVTKFCKAFRAILQGQKGLVESTAEDGGYTVPEDIQTTVNKWAEVGYSLLTDIDVVPVTTNKGARTYQKRTDADVFVDIDETGAITKEIEAPKFERVPYSIQDRAGFMPVSNDLIADSDANILAIVGEWLGKANVATSNAKILGIIQAKEQVDLADVAGIKKVVNVTLGQAYKGSAKIYTNDDGLNYLDTLEDNNGRPLLNPDPTDSARLQLRCGTVVVPIKVLPNKILPSDGTKVPVIVGDLKAGIRKWDRQSMSVKASDVASIGNFNAFAQNMTLLRAVLRDDYTELDSAAYVNGYIDTAAEE